MTILVIDVGTTGLRAAAVRPDGTVAHLVFAECPPSSPFPGLVEFDPRAMVESVRTVASTVLQHSGPVAAVGIATQRASTIMWDARTMEPLGNGLGWQDLRTVGECIAARETHGLALAPNQTATKAAWLLRNHPHDVAHVRIGTVDSWIVAALSNGDLHVTDHTNAAVTGLYDLATMGWSGRACDLLGIDPSVLPRIVDSSGVIGEATALDGSPPIASIVGDQQSSLLGQGCTRPGDTKITFGTGGMLDTVTGSDRPTVDTRLPGGTFPIVAHTSGSGMTFGVEGIMLSAGANVEWLCHDLGILGTPEESDALAASVASSDDVVYVPALLGLGTPHWDYGARGTLLGVTRGTTRAHVVRAVLEGIAHRGADLVDAAVADTGQTIERVRVDGGMSRNITFVQALADVTARPIDVCAITEATTLGAAFLAGTAIGAWASLDEAAAAGQSARTVEPANPARRDRWADAVARSREWIPELSALDF